MIIDYNAWIVQDIFKASLFWNPVPKFQNLYVVILDSKM